MRGARTMQHAACKRGALACLRLRRGGGTCARRHDTGLRLTAGNELARHPEVQHACVICVAPVERHAHMRRRPTPQHAQRPA